MLLIASDTITASRASIRRAIASQDEAVVEAECRRAEAAGARWVDLNPGHLRRSDRGRSWRWLVETAERATTCTLMLDAPDAESLALALEACSRPAVLNMATAHPERLGPVLDLARAHDADVVCGLMDGGGPPPSVDERLALASVLVGAADERGIPRQRLYLDPLVMPLALQGGEAHAAAVLGVLRALPWVFDPPPRSLLGVSNLVTGAAGARPRSAAPHFLAAASGAGLTAALLDVRDGPLLAAARLCDVYSGERIFAPAELDDEAPGQ